MTINDTTLPVGAIESGAPSRVGTHRMIALGAAAVVAAATLVTVVQNFGNDAAQPPARAVQSVDARAITRDLVERGLIPRQALQPAPLSVEAKLRDLVDRGLIPRQALEPAPLSVDAKLRDLVERGLIPRQALGD